VSHQASFGEVDLYKGRLSRDILHKISWLRSKSTRKPHDVDETHIPLPALHSAYVGSMESTSGSKLFLGPSRLSAEDTNAFAELLSGILAHAEKIQQLKAMSLQTISSIYLSRKLFKGKNLDSEVYVYDVLNVIIYYSESAP
jgi:hypothetical protein